MSRWRIYILDVNVPGDTKTTFWSPKNGKNYSPKALL